uniref:Uncharacterized protein n=1 Tax=Oryza punctata TaxID=4537 RepID=A0A0E0LMI5_ORYPU
MERRENPVEKLHIALEAPLREGTDRRRGHTPTYPRAHLLFPTNGLAMSTTSVREEQDEEARRRR